MPNRKTHTTTGTVIGILYSIANQKSENRFSMTELMGSAAGGYTGGQLADIFDPTDSPNHRKSGHSIIAALTGAAIVQIAVRNLRTSRKQLQNTADRYIQYGYDIPVETIMKVACNELLTGFLMGLSAGYMSHLALDSLTPAGINL
ncbi:MAG: hypothetical protein GQ565_06915 [Candidatus Aegiribacteria sp.]|nr:hypothetical protein [Candidatus Aegiribacteria sp.]